MSYIAVSYQILFEDTMAYGSHHYLTNFRFQCIAREHFFFNGLFSQETFKDVVILTQQGYSRNMAPVFLGERVAIFLTFDEPTRSTTRLCFRVVRYDGVPVCCGYQMLVFTDRITGELIPVPTVLVNYVMQNLGLIERVANPAFAERVVKGGKELKNIFTPEICELGQLIATDTQRHGLGVEIVDSSNLLSIQKEIRKITPFVSDAASNWQKVLNGHISNQMSEPVIFMFPGQGSYDYQTLKIIHNNYPSLQPYFDAADAATQNHFGRSFSSLIQTTSQKEHDRLLQEFPDLEQVGIFLTNIMLATLLKEHGLSPHILVGHSFGELAALTVAGAFDFNTGLEIVCHRILSLQQMETSFGGMLAITCGAERLPELVHIIQQTQVTVAIVNHPQQIILSGVQTELKQVELYLLTLNIPCTFLKSRYPFHSTLLTAAMETFAASLQHIQFQSPQISVYSPIEQGFYGENTDFPRLLASHLIRPFNFCDTVKFFQQRKVHSWIECGAGKVLSRLVKKNWFSDSQPHILPVVSPD